MLTHCGIRRVGGPRSARGKGKGKDDYGGKSRDGQTGKEECFGEMFTGFHGDIEWFSAAAGFLRRDYSELDVMNSTWFLMIASKNLRWTGRNLIGKKTIKYVVIMDRRLLKDNQLFWFENILIHDWTLPANLHKKPMPDALASCRWNYGEKGIER